MRIILIMLISAFIVIAGCTNSNSKGSKGNAMMVRVAKTEFKDIPRDVTVVATLDGMTQVDVFSRVSGRLTYLGPQEGDKVAKGQLLFRVDRNDPGESFLNTPVYSPVAGWVGRWNVINLGSHITTQDVVVTIVDDTSLKATVFLPLQEWTSVKHDTVVKVDVYNQQRDAKIVTIARSADPASGRGSVVIEIPNSDRSWRSGMSAKVLFALDPKPRMLLDSDAVSLTDQGAFVFVVSSDDKVKRTKVNFDVINSDTVEILGGLDVGSLVVTSGNNLLSEGSSVSILDEAKDIQIEAKDKETKSKSKGL